MSQLVDTLKLAIDKTGITKIAVAGGVSANEELRRRFDELAGKGCEVHYPKLKYCTDNAAMIGAEACFMIKDGVEPSELTLDAKATVPLK